MLDFLGSIFTGGLTGLLGVVVQRWADYMNKKQDIELKRMDLDHAAKMKEVDAAIMREEWTQRVKVAEVEAAGREAAADSEAFAASFKMEPKRFSDAKRVGGIGNFCFVLLDVVRGFVRPALTVYLCVLTTLIYFQIKGILGAVNLTQIEALDLMRLIVTTILYLTTTVVLWWFGTRNKQRPPAIKT